MHAYVLQTGGLEGRTESQEYISVVKTLIMLIRDQVRFTYSFSILCLGSSLAPRNICASHMSDRSVEAHTDRQRNYQIP